MALQARRLAWVGSWGVVWHWLTCSTTLNASAHPELTAYLCAGAALGLQTNHSNTNGFASHNSGLKGYKSWGSEPSTPGGTPRTPRKGVQPGSFVDLLVSEHCTRCSHKMQLCLCQMAVESPAAPAAPCAPPADVQPGIFVDLLVRMHRPSAALQLSALLAETLAAFALPPCSRAKVLAVMCRQLASAYSRLHAPVAHMCSVLTRWLAILTHTHTLWQLRS